ncbi:Polycomb complex protein BMI-1 [Trichoplax sp. H2]|nr:Polycomb complex protein BMI-1 [Trichoplax sp. H2]|eukprot:RDD42702.1 Polycomb complex protein BMI-1 [Trichoplax sp. H2]
MQSEAQVKVQQINPHVICYLCQGYLIDATTITECLHSFCRSCIVKHFDKSLLCPLCNLRVHETRPHLNIRSDTTLQEIVYGLVPGLLKEENRRRLDFYNQHGVTMPKSELLSNNLNKRRQSEDSQRTCITLENISSSQFSNGRSKASKIRYLRCPSHMRVVHLKKFIKMKTLMPDMHMIDVFHNGRLIDNEFMLEDVAVIYANNTGNPLHLQFKITPISQSH